MAQVVKHRFISPVQDEGDATVVGPNEWNDEHVFSGGSNGFFLKWDSTQPDNVGWENIWASGAYIDVTKPPFNAIGTGLVDALSPITSALAVGSIIIPSGTFAISGKITVPSNRDIVILPGATVQALTGSSFIDEGMFHLNTVSNIRIVGGGTIDGNKTGNPLGRANAIHILDATNITIEGIRIINCPGSTAQGGASGDGVFVGGTLGSTNVLIENCLIDNNVRTGVSLVKGTNLKVSRNTISNTTGTSNGYGISVESALISDTLAEIKLFDNNIVGNEKGLVFSANSGAGSCIVTGNNFGAHRTSPNVYIRRSEVTFTNNSVFVSNGNGVYIQNCSRVRVSNNFVAGINAVAEGTGILMSDADSTIVSDNNVKTVRIGGIGISQIVAGAVLASSYIQIRGNILTNCGVDHAIYFHCPASGAAMQFISVVNNTIVDNRGASSAVAGISSSNLSATLDSFTWDVHSNIVSGTINFTLDNRFKQFQALHIEPTLDFGSITGPNYQDLNVVLDGVVGGDTVYLGVPSGAMVANAIYQAFVSGTSQVTVRCVVTTGTVNPPSSTFRITVVRNA